MYLSIYLSIYLYIYIYLHSSVYLHIYLYIYLSIYLFIHLCTVIVFLLILFFYISVEFLSVAHLYHLISNLLLQQPTVGSVDTTYLQEKLNELAYILGTYKVAQCSTVWHNIVVGHDVLSFITLKISS